MARQQVTVITAKQLLTLRGRAAPLFLLQSMFSAVGAKRQRVKRASENDSHNGQATADIDLNQVGSD